MRVQCEVGETKYKIKNSKPKKILSDPQKSDKTTEILFSIELSQPISIHIAIQKYYALEPMSLIQNDATTNTSHHSCDDNAQANSSRIFFSAGEMEQYDLIQQRGNCVENSNCERIL